MSFLFLFLNVRYRILMLLTLYSIHAYHDLIQTCFSLPLPKWHLFSFGVAVHSSEAERVVTDGRRWEDAAQVGSCPAGANESTQNVNHETVTAEKDIFHHCAIMLALPVFFTESMCWNCDGVALKARNVASSEEQLQLAQLSVADLVLLNKVP